MKDRVYKRSQHNYKTYNYKHICAKQIFMSVDGLKSNLFLFILYVKSCYFNTRITSNVLIFDTRILYPFLNIVNQNFQFLFSSRSIVYFQIIHCANSLNCDFFSCL